MSLQDPDFYVKQNVGSLVAADYLQYNGEFINDVSNISIAQGTPIFDSTGSLISNGNPGGTLIVPADYSIASSQSLGASVANTIAAAEASTGSQTAGVQAGFQSMEALFDHGGAGDLQRTYDGLSWSGNADMFVDAFDDAASFNLGLVTELAGLPLGCRFI